MKHELKSIAAAIFSAVLFAFPAHAASPDSARVAEILDTSARATGGREALLAVRGFESRGEIVTISDGLGGKVEISLLLDGSLRREARKADRTQIAILSGTLAWSGGRRSQHPAPREMRDELRLQFHEFAAPFELAAANAEDFTIEREDAESVRLVRSWGKELSTSYEIETATGLVRRTIGRAGTGEGSTLIVAEFGDFQDVEGPKGSIKIAHRMTIRRGDRVVSKISFDRIETREAFSDATFLPMGTADDF